MKRLVIPLTKAEHAAALAKAEVRGATVTAIVREAFDLPPARPRGRTKLATKEDKCETQKR